ncbi:MAG: hypothetical protein IPK82_18155 [Polyangiaceae bacterium]|nr:hypothetical protein [Polyangiaceae bacterium]
MTARITALIGTTLLLAACSSESRGTGGGTSSSATVASVGGSGGSSSTGGTGGVHPLACGKLDQDGCLSAYPTCVPVYDDVCCPTCEPGECTDCLELAFHHCAEHETVCGPEPLNCGVVPDWACSNG